MFGVINVCKPKGLTSHDVVGVIRKILSIKQVGHTGTLDPFAEGVLPVCVGKATRLIDYFDDDKEYLATIQLGASTDTYDLEGIITNKSSKKVKREDIEKALLNFKGEISQLPPMYSAIKVNGKKLYEYARAGETVNIEPRTVTIYNIELKTFDEMTQIAEILVSCSKGTYIRSIANDLGVNLGCFGHLIKLVRTRAGKFSLESAINLPIKIDESSDSEHSKKYSLDSDAKEKIIQAIHPPLSGLSLPVITVNDTDFERISHGNSIKAESEKIKSGDFLILVYNNNVIAIGQYDGVEIKVKKVLI
ncbi:tRNA pseudouridine(55) synthase TruB [bacterium]|nr:tRNA pseudouridine(55) synthase TruB [bacterium]